MKASDFFQSQPLLVEIRQSGLTLRLAREAVDAPLERQMNGRITEASRDQAAAILRDFLQRHGGKRQRTTVCAIDARGVSFRLLSLPRAGDDELRRMLPLQIESEFPLPPDALAWGWQRMPGGDQSAGSQGSAQTVIVAALRKEVVQDYDDLLKNAGLEPVFTLSAWVLSAVLPLASRPLPAQTGPHLLHFDRQSVLAIRREQGAVIEARSIPVLLEGTADTGLGIQESAKELLRSLYEKGTVTFTGVVDQPDEIARVLTAAVGKPVSVEALRGLQTEPFTVLTALETALARIGLESLPRLELNQPGPVVTKIAPEWRKWAALAALLALCAVILRYGEAFARGPALERALKKFDAQKADLPRIDREVGLLQHLAQSQPPYVEAMYMLATAAPPGTRLDSLSMTRRGDLSWKGMFANPQQAGDFRTKLVASEYFSSVVIEEQTPAPDRQRVSVRMTAQWKGAEARPKLPDPPSMNAVTNVPAATGNPPGGSVPAQSVKPPSASSTNSPPEVTKPPAAPKSAMSTPRGAARGVWELIVEAAPRVGVEWEGNFRLQFEDLSGEAPLISRSRRLACVLDCGEGAKGRSPLSHDNGRPFTIESGDCAALRHRTPKRKRVRTLQGFVKMPSGGVYSETPTVPPNPITITPEGRMA